MKNAGPFKLVVNLVAFNAAWFACAFAGAWNHPWLAIGTVAGVLGLHFALSERPGREALVVAVVGVMGTLVDTVQMHLGVINFSNQGDGPLIPAWFIAFWLNFATLLNVSLRWMQGRYAIAAVFGALGGPAAYYAGVRLGAITLHPDTSLALVAIGIAWAMVTPMLLAVAQASRRARTTARDDCVGQEIGLGREVERT